MGNHYYFISLFEFDINNIISITIFIIFLKTILIPISNFPILKIVEFNFFVFSNPEYYFKEIILLVKIFNIGIAKNTNKIIIYKIKTRLNNDNFVCAKR